MDATVVYIAGSGRSGSTLLSLLVGQAFGLPVPGEVMQTWSRGAIRNELCGCGAPFRECRFWAHVRALAPHAFLDPERHDVAIRQHRLRDGLALMAGVVGTSWIRRVEACAPVLQELNAAIGMATNANAYVDASKSPLYGLLLRGARMDVRVIHCVRDARAMAFSWGRVRPRPESVGGVEAEMVRRGAAYGGAHWTLVNLMTERLLRTPYLRVRYEDVVADPQLAMRRIGSFLGRSPLSGSELHPSAFHTVSGNPMRLSSGRIHIRADEEWRVQMKLADKAVATALSAPLMLRYGYGL